jgi:L-lactate permease
VTHTLFVLCVGLACALVLFFVGQRLPAFASITRSATYVVGVVALIYVARTWMPRKGQRRHGERRHDDDRRAG